MPDLPNSFGSEAESRTVWLSEGRGQVGIAAHRAKLGLFRLCLVTVIAGPHGFLQFVVDILWKFLVDILLDTIFGTFQQWLGVRVCKHRWCERVGFDRILEIRVDVIPLAQIQWRVHVQRESAARGAKLRAGLLGVLGRQH